MKICKQFVDVGDRRVMVRYAGHGPALVLLHQSPQNSRAMIPWIERLSDRYAVFAPDTPGFGESDPLPLAQPEIPDYAAALARLLDMLGIERTMVYGVHTGASTALRLALDFPQKIAVLICDGYARFGAAEREALLSNYLPPFEPVWDGTHLAWLFARLREQHLFFPWHDGAQSARLAYPVPTSAHIHEDVLQVLDAGDGYRAGYRAPFLYDDVSAVARLTVPAYIYYRAEDVLALHLHRLPKTPPHVLAEMIAGGPPVLIARADAVFAAHAAEAAVQDAAKCVAAAQSATRKMIATTEGDLGFRLIPGRGNEAMIHLHDIGSPARAPVICDLAAITVLPDLPGHGASRDWSQDQCAPDEVARALVTLLDSLDLDRVSIFATGGGCAIGVALVRAIRQRAKRLTLQNPLPLDNMECAQFLGLLPDLTPTSTGAQLIAAWNFARMKYLFWSWLPQNGQAARRTVAPAAWRVQADAVEILRAGECFNVLWRKALELDLGHALSQLQVPIELMATPEDEPVRLAARLAAATSLQPAHAPGIYEGWKSWKK